MVTPRQPALLTPWLRPVVLGYLRVSTREQADSGLGLNAQRATIAAEAERRGWDVRWIEDAGVSAATLARPGISEALRALAAREASALVVAKLDRLSRSVVDFAATLDLARRQRWNLVALDLGVDLSTPAGEMMANVLASFAQYERRLIGQRTSDAMAEAKARGTHCGRPREVGADLVARISDLADGSGETFTAIARRLTAEGVPTPRGARIWSPSTVARIVRADRRQAQAVAS